jgi:hypothetical protein
MASITITVPDAAAPKFVAMLTALYPTATAGLTGAAAAKAAIVEWLLENITAYEAQLAAQSWASQWQAALATAQTTWKAQIT